MVRGLLLAALLLAAGAAQVPGKPTDVVLKPLAGTLDALDVSWTAPSGTVAGYDVEYKQRADAETEWTDGATDTTATTQSLTGLDASTPYVVRVRATNSSGDGAWSDNGSASTHPPEEELHDTERYQRIPRGVKPGQRFRLLTAVGSVAATSADNFIVSAGNAGALGSQEFRQSTGRYQALVSTPGVEAYADGVGIVLLAFHKAGFVRRMCRAAVLLEAGGVTATGADGDLVDALVAGQGAGGGRGRVARDKPRRAGTTWTRS